jgi:ubiquinone/menaquinone biosynthesis C-methylase UbiE
MALGASGRLLDVGTGPGRLLMEIHRLAPSLELHGLDISEAMVRRAKENLGAIPCELLCGSIRRTQYASGFFDVVTCSGSFYLWDCPEKCIEEIWRILKDGARARLYESTRDFDRQAFQAALRQNLAGETLVRRLTASYYLRKQLRITYSTGEIRQIVERTSFRATHTLERVSLSRLPVFVRISLFKKQVLPSRILTDDRCGGGQTASDSRHGCPPARSYPGMAKEIGFARCHA